MTEPVCNNTSQKPCNPKVITLFGLEINNAQLEKFFKKFFNSFKTFFQLSVESGSS